MDEIKKESNESNTVTLEAEPAKVVVDNKTPSREELKENGWSEKELEAAEKRGMIEKKEEKKEIKKDAPPVEIGVPVKKAEEKPAEEKPKEEIKPNGSLPDFTFKTPEQEKAFLDAFGAGTPQRAMYFRMKNERQARQRAESEKQRIELEAQLLKDRLEKIEGKLAPQDVDENGNPIDPDDKPLTIKQLKEMWKQQAEESARKQEELNKKGNSVSQALTNQEEYVKSVYPDFDEACKLAADLMKNLETLIPEKWKQDKAIRMIKDLQTTAANADTLGLDDYNAAIISYELGQMHPNYGKANGDPSDDVDGNLRPEQRNNGGLTPEQMKRIEANTQRRASSASIPGGGGKRVISVEDITIKDVLKMNSQDRENFRKKHPEKMRQLLRG